MARSVRNKLNGRTEKCHVVVVPKSGSSCPIPNFGDLVLSKFMNNLMLDGKKSVAERIVYGALEVVEAKAKKDPVQTFHEALNNVKPGIEVRSAVALVVLPIRCLAKSVRNVLRLWLSAG